VLVVKIELMKTHKLVLYIKLTKTSSNHTIFLHIHCIFLHISTYFNSTTEIKNLAFRYIGCIMQSFFAEYVVSTFSHTVIYTSSSVQISSNSLNVQD